MALGEAVLTEIWIVNFRFYRLRTGVIRASDLRMATDRRVRNHHIASRNVGHLSRCDYF